MALPLRPPSGPQGRAQGLGRPTVVVQTRREKARRPRLTLGRLSPVPVRRLAGGGLGPTMGAAGPHRPEPSHARPEATGGRRGGPCRALAAGRPLPVGEPAIGATAVASPPTLGPTTLPARQSLEVRTAD